MTVVGRGLQFPTAYETALKIRELSGIPAEAFSPPDLMHGPIAALGASGARLAGEHVRARAAGPGELDALARDAGLTVAVSDDDGVLAGADIGVADRRPGCREWLAPMVAVIPGQAAALRLGELRGVDARSPARAAQGDADA